LDAVAGHELFSFYDGYAGYHQVAIRKEDRWKTVFTMSYGTYWYLRMPFGMCNWVGTFQRLQMKVLEPYLGKFIRVYLDGFCVYGGRANHVEQLRLTFERLTLFQCSLSPEKCRFGFEEGVLLGHVVFARGIKVGPGKITAILALEPPTSTQEVKKM
jgi:hypothetical protein